MTNSNHFTDEDWADFTRNVADSDRRAAMQRHLEEGCQQCAELHDGLEAVQAAAAADARYEPPPGTVRQAKALCKFQEPVSPFAWALETVKLFVQHGADPRRRDSNGVAPVDRAEALGMTRVAAYLRDLGK